MLNSTPLSFSAEENGTADPSRVVLPTLVIGLGGTGFQTLDRL